MLFRRLVSIERTQNHFLLNAIFDLSLNKSPSQLHCIADSITGLRFWTSPFSLAKLVVALVKDTITRKDSPKEKLRRVPLCTKVCYISRLFAVSRWLCSFLRRASPRSAETASPKLSSSKDIDARWTVANFLWNRFEVYMDFYKYSIRIIFFFFFLVIEKPTKSLRVEIFYALHSRDGVSPCGPTPRYSFSRCRSIGTDTRNIRLDGVGHFSRTRIESDKYTWFLLIQKIHVRDGSERVKKKKEILTCCKCRKK